jgi:hypothetical protein
MFQQYMVIISLAAREKISTPLYLGLRSQCFTYVLYKMLHIKLDSLGDGKNVKSLFTL